MDIVTSSSQAIEPPRSPGQSTQPARDLRAALRAVLGPATVNGAHYPGCIALVPIWARQRFSIPPVAPIHLAAPHTYIHSVPQAHSLAT